MKTLYFRERTLKVQVSGRKKMEIRVVCKFMMIVCCRKAINRKIHKRGVRDT